MAMTIGRGDGQAYSDINMTPLIDIMLVLLIVFIITIPSQTHSISIDTPVAGPQAGELKVVELLIDFDGAVFWNGQPLDRHVLHAYVRREAAETPQSEVRISVDKFAKYEDVAQTLAELQRQGLKRIGFVNTANL
jgi:biopolymer transport protein ExbD